MDRNVLVTGGAGFIGSWVCKRLVASGFTVTNLDKLTYAANLASLHSLEQQERYRFVRGDIADAKLVGSVLRDRRVGAVVNLAAESHVDRSRISAPADFIQTNIVGTFNLLRTVADYVDDLPATLRPHFRFLHVSTDEVYGSLGDDGSVNEDSPYRPRSPYAASKASVPIIWCRRSFTRMDCRLLLSTAATIMDRTDFPKSLFHSPSSMPSSTRNCRSMGAA